MKDLKHYFTDNAKACETSNVEAKEVTTHTVIDIAGNEEQASGLSRRKKRGRVKIKISQSNSRGKVCDIIDSKSDLIDKTPSPFTPREHKIDECSRHDTPKTSKSLPRKSSKTSKRNGVASSNSKSEIENVSSDDENDNLISNMTQIGNVHTPLMQSADASFGRISTMGREESNAFQVLMTRKKSIQYREPVPLSLNDEELAVNIIEERKVKLKQNREKLTVIANKKGYTKRKINEAEEAEMIEMRLEKRAKVFRQLGKKETEDKTVVASHRRVSPGSLHNYFIPSNIEKKDKNPMVSCDADIPDSPVTVMSEDIESAQTNPLCSDTPADEAKSPSQRSKKPKWSLRINLHCNDRNIEDDPIVEKNDRALRGQKESKPRQSKVKTPNYEETGSCEVETSKLKKKRSSSKIRNSKSSSSAQSPSIEQSKSSPAIVTIFETTEIVQSFEPEILEIKVVGKPEKLAPLFVKRSKPDPAVLEARRAFLYSAPIENENRKVETKLPIVGSPFLPFPTISHVTQLSTETTINNSLLKSIYPIRETKPQAPSFDFREFESLINLGKDVSKKLNDSIETTKSSPEEVLGEIESRCADARELWTKICTKSKKFKEARISPKKQRGRRRKNVENKNETDECTNHDCIWTEKYRPTNTDDIVGNEEAAGKFREWLNGWTANGQKDSESSGDEFYPSDCSLVSNVNNNQVAVLLGPHGSGKTASVYAIAEELGYRILEVNASSKRTGKKISKELEEATKSHRIKQSEVMMFKSKTKTNDTKLPRNSLILIEDVDLIFEEDEGFIAATFQLASNTKRPIVMTGKDTCSHLNRMAPNQLRIYYQTAVGSRVAALLELITLAECGHRLPRQCLDRLLQNGDLRKALLQLQYLLLSGKPSASGVSTNFHQSLWQDMRPCIYNPAIRAMRKSKKRHSNVEKTPPGQEAIITNNTAKDLENVSFLSTLIDIDDPTLHDNSVKLEQSLSLDENTHDYSSVSITSLEIAQWLRDRVMKDDKAIHSGNELQNMRQLLLKRELNIGVNSALAHVSPHSLNHRSTVLDYLPSIRTICRAEEVRTTCNNKRGNRFFHYLQNLRLPALSTRPSILTAACKIMHEKNSES